MNIIGLLFTLVAGVLLLRLPRHWAFLPLIMGAAYMTRGPVLEVGPASFTAVRLLVTIGFLRVLSRREKLAGGINTLDKMVIAWATWLVVGGIFHTAGALIFRVGVLWSEVGSYFLLRIFVRGPEDLYRIFKTLCVLLVPVGVAMLVERMTGTNYFALLGAVSERADLRNGHFRAGGPFAHAILAGSVGAMCFPMALYLWKTDRKLALLGMSASGAMVFASGSSGPLMALFAALFALALWKVRTWLRAILWFGLMGILALDVVMNDPVYFLMARIDITGGSTGWYRAALIRSAIEHFGEWWLVGTDHTRHWMATGIIANEFSTDITNHILQMGVWGGLLLVFLFTGILAAAFSIVRRALRLGKEAQPEQQFLIWTLGAILFGHVTNFFSITYYDQSVVFFYLLLAGIASFYALDARIRAPNSASNETGKTSQHKQDFCYSC